MDYLKIFRINRVIKYLIFCDLVFWSGWGFLSPVFAVFVVEKIEGGNLKVVGMATAIYWILKSLLRIPFSIFLDRRKGEEDDFWFLFFGLIFASFSSFGYLMARYPWHVYFLQAIYAIAMAMVFSAFLPIFTRHIDKGKEATEWAIDATAVGLGTGFAGFFGGVLASNFGFKILFVLVGIFGISSAFLILPILKFISPRSKDKGMLFSLKDLFDHKEK
jgi:MFS family permease